MGAGHGAEKINSATGSFSVRGALDIDTSSSSMETNGVAEESSSSQQAEFIERVKYIPLRLTLSERKSLRLCEAALNVSNRIFDRISVQVISVYRLNMLLQKLLHMGNMKTVSHCLSDVPLHF